MISRPSLIRTALMHIENGSNEKAGILVDGVAKTLKPEEASVLRQSWNDYLSARNALISVADKL